MMYSVICTDTSEYIHWQAELLEYSWSRVHQPGQLLRLVACADDETLPVHRHARVIRTNPSNVHPESGDVYVPYNRLFSFRQWLEEHQPEGTVLILDPDNVFRKPIYTQVSPGKPMGQHWLDFGLSDEYRAAIETLSDVAIDRLQPFTWPALIHTSDLRRLISRWIELTAEFRNIMGGWESDMFALVVASAELGLEFELGTTAAFMPWPAEDVQGAPIVHYCQRVMAQDGSELWWKVDYTPWDRVKHPDRAELDYCRDLLALVDEHAQIRQFDQQLDDQDTIFVAMGAYCEPEVASTIESCLTKARHPERLRFGICLQYDNSSEDTNSKSLDRFSQDSRVRYVKYPYTDSRGGCWARNIAQQLYDGERYTLQIDAHSQMIESWDTLLIKMMHDLPSDKPLISEFPPLYHFENGEKVFRHIEDLSQVNTAFAEKWGEDGALHHPQKLVPENNVFPRRTRFISGAFVFTLGQWNEEVMQDPEHFYTGEEFALAVRSFTHGYDLFDPNQIVVWHRLHPHPNRKFWNDNDETTVSDHHNYALQRLRWLFEDDPEDKLGRFGLGTARNLDDFYVYSGLDCRTLSIHPDAANGIPPDPITVKPPGMTKAPAPRLLEIKVHIKGMKPLELACDEETPVLESLFQSLLDKKHDPNSVIYLTIGENGEQTVRFNKASLVCVETNPELSESFFAKLAQSTDKAQG